MESLTRLPALRKSGDLAEWPPSLTLATRLAQVGMPAASFFTSAALLALLLGLCVQPGRSEGRSNPATTTWSWLVVVVEVVDEPPVPEEPELPLLPHPAAKTAADRATRRTRQLRMPTSFVRAGVTIGDTGT